MATIPNVILNSENGQTMPVIGMGTASYPLGDEEITKIAIVEAIKIGYRHFDTSYAYQSEKALGEAIAVSLKMGFINSREELFITSKLWCSSGDRDLVVPALKTSLRTLQLDYLDMYLIHIPLKFSKEVNESPYPRELIFPMDIKSVWEGMEECKNLGLSKSIGVSNFSCNKLEQLLSTAKILPALNQVELNLLWQQEKLREFCEAKGIHITAYSPLGSVGTWWGHNQIVESDVLKEIAMTRGKTIPQVALRWVYEQGVSLIVKSFNKERMKQNIEIFDWSLSLSEEESNKIKQLPQRKAVLFSHVFGPHDIILQLDAEL